MYLHAAVQERLHKLRCIRSQLKVYDHDVLKVDDDGFELGRALHDLTVGAQVHLPLYQLLHLSYQRAQVVLVDTLLLVRLIY